MRSVLCGYASEHASMGRREQKERERKRAASSCQSLDRFLPPKKIISDGADRSESAADTSLASGTSAPARVGELDGTGGDDRYVVMSDMAQTSSELPSSEPAMLPSAQCRSDDAAHGSRHTGGQSCDPVDIGSIFSRVKSPREFWNVVQFLSTAQKCVQ